MSDLSGNMFYSFNSGLVHFLVVASEIYYDVTLSDKLPTQYDFVRQDLALANLNRNVRPWIVVLSHRNFYCSNTPDPGFDSCSEEFSPMREGINNGSKFRFGLENIFHKFGVDFLFAGHKHSYERFYPTFQGKMYGTKSDTYVDPEAVVMVTQGNAGCRNDLGHFVKPAGGWPLYSAVRISEYGYSQLTIVNSSLATFQMISDKGKVLDKFAVVKTNPHPHRRG
jgi:alkaline phosphatase D